MKKYRPTRSGFIVLYVLVAIAACDAAYTLIGTLTGAANEYIRSFSFFSYLIAAMAIAYVRIYARAVVAIDEKYIRIAFPAYIKPPVDGKRAFIIYRQGNLDMKLIDKTFPLANIQRYGYVDDLGYSRVDQSSTDETSPLFPVKEVCFLTSDGKRYHMNAGNYNWSQLKEMFNQITDNTGIAPEGSLAEILTWDADKEKARKEKAKAARQKAKGKR